MIAAAQLPGLRMYDLRHHCITSLLEDPRVSEETVEAIAGHVSRRMMKRYSHIRSAAKRAAVCGLYSSSGEVFKGGEPRALLPENTLTNEVVSCVFCLYQTAVYDLDNGCGGHAGGQQPQLSQFQTCLKPD